MNSRRIIDKLLPPALAWRLGRASREKHELERFAAFYGGFLRPGDLCFDVGANLGNRTRCFLHLGCRVVAVEPQTTCFQQLRRHFGGNPGVNLVHMALGRSHGTATLHTSRDHVLSSISEEFIGGTRASGRFAGTAWDGMETVGMTTLDSLVAEFGMPAFVKIDVEGYESEVLSGLSVPVPALSIEWVPEMPANARACLHHLAGLADYEFNISWGESMRFSRPAWRSLESILAVIGEFEGEASLFGDIYARRRDGA